MIHRPTSQTMNSSQQRLRDGFGRLRAWALPTMLAAPLSLFAHPGHGHEPVIPPAQPAHWFLEPEHLATWAVMGVMTWTLYRILLQRTKRSEPAPERTR